MKKPPSKVAHNRPQFSFQYWPGCSNQSRIDFSYYKYDPRLICLLICAHTICISSRLLQDEVERSPEDKMKRNKKMVVARAVGECTMLDFINSQPEFLFSFPSKQVRPLT